MTADRRQRSNYCCCCCCRCWCRRTSSETATSVWSRRSCTAVQRSLPRNYTAQERTSDGPPATPSGRTDRRLRVEVWNDSEMQHCDGYNHWWTAAAPRCDAPLRRVFAAVPHSEHHAQTSHWTIENLNSPITTCISWHSTTPTRTPTPILADYHARIVARMSACPATSTFSLPQ